MTYPEEFGSTGWLAEDGQVEDAAAALIKRFGRGCYSNDLDSGHGCYCLALATALGIAKAEDYAILENAYPTKAIDLITEWERQLGLTPPPLSWTIEARWQRLSARCTEAKGNNPAVLAVAFGILVGATCYVSETDAATIHCEGDESTDTWYSNRFELCVILPLATWGSNTWGDCVRLRDRVEHAHGRIYLAVTHDSGSPHRHPVFRTDESLTDRDCCRPD